MGENTMTEFRTEGQPAFPVSKENDTPSESSTDKTDSDQTGTSDQDKKETENKNGAVDERLFNHPRWVERENDWKNRYNEQEKRHLGEIEKLRAEIQALGTSKTEKSSDDNVPEWWGGDEKQWAAFQEWTKGLTNQAKSEAIKELSAKTEAEQKAVEDSTKYMQEQVAALETDSELNPKGEKIDQNKLFKIVLEHKLVDTEGRWNYRAGYLIMKGLAATTPDSTKERKGLAAATTSNNRAEDKPIPFMTSKDFSKPGMRPW